MKKVDYGYNMSDEPLAMFEGIGISNVPEGAVEGEYLGVIEREGEDYLISRTTMAFKDDPNYIGKITARRALAEVHSDGSGVIFIDVDENEKTRDIEMALNSRDVQKGDFERIVSRGFDSLIANDEIYAIAIKHEVFERKKMLTESSKSDFVDEMGKTY